MTNPIVNVSVSVQSAPIPSLLQKTGAFISQGATNTSPGTQSPLTQLSSLTPLLTGAKAIFSITWVSGVASVVTVAPHGFTPGDSIYLTIAGASPAGYNTTALATITGTSSFTYPLPVGPGGETVPGVYTIEDVAELVAMATTFFGQGAAQSVYVLELGPGNPNDGVAFLTSWIAANPNVFYSYLVPRTWDANANFLALIANFQATGSKTYFFVTTTLATYLNYTAQMKDVVSLIEAPNYSVWPANALTAISYAAGQVTANTTTNHGVSPGQYFTISGVSPSGFNGTFLAQPGTATNILVYNLASSPGIESVLGTLVASFYASAGIPATEFSLAAVFRVTLNYAPSSTNKVTQLNQAFVFGVTPFPTQGNSALITALLAAGTNLIGTGAAGGISNALVLGGQTEDGNPFKYWYSIDWVQINLARNVQAAIINGANNPINPVDYNQPGINTLQQAATTTMSTGINSGLVLNPIKQTGLSAAQLVQALDSGTYSGTTLVNADPFSSYTTENPNDYGNGVYNGIAVYYAPLRGFETVNINVVVSNFAA